MNGEILFAVTIIILVSIVCITVIACTAICAAQERWKIKNGVKPIVLKSNEYIAENW